MVDVAPKGGAAPARTLREVLGGWLLFIAVETATQIAFKFAGATLDDRYGLGHLVGQALTTPVVWLGFGLYFCGFLIGLTILKDLDLGRAFPMTPIIYVSTVQFASVAHVAFLRSRRPS